jgi:ribosomal protein S18 acetylase RimI-like enzyme
MLYVDEDNESGKGLYKTLGFKWRNFDSFFSTSKI